MKQQLRHGLPRLGGGGERLQLDICQHFIAVARGCQFRKLRQAAPFCSPKRFSDGICLSSCEPPKTVHTAQSHLVQYSLLNARNAPIQHTSVPLGFYNLRSSVAPPQQRHSGRSELVIINALVVSCAIDDEKPTSRYLSHVSIWITSDLPTTQCSLLALLI